MKKKKVIIGISFIVLLLIIGGVSIWLFSRKDKKVDNNTSLEEKLVVKDKVEMNSGSTFDKTLFFYQEVNLDEYEFSFERIDKEGDLVFKDDIIYSIGNYKVTIKYGEEEYISNLEVIDKTAPELEVTDLNVSSDEEVTVNSFVKSCTDNSEEECILSILDSDKKKVDKVSSDDSKYYIRAKDSNGNESLKEVSLTYKSEDKKSTDSKTSSKGSSSSSKKSSSSSSSSSTKTKTKTEKKTEKSTSKKYGVTITTTKTYEITTYSDGSQSKKLKSTKNSYDYSGFNATTSDLKSEASKTVSSNSSTYSEMLKYVNKYRKEVGVDSLTMSADLNLAATIRAMEMAWANKTSHTRPNGDSCFTVLSDLSISYWASGENIAWGQTSVKSVSETWRNSSGHYANMISENYARVGFGKYKLNGQTYWVQIFTS